MSLEEGICDKGVHLMNVEEFSEHYQVRRLTENDTEIVFSLCKQNSRYYEYCPPFVTIESICQDMVKLPPKKSREDKYYIGYFDAGRLIAVMDLIDGYPDTRTAFIGFFMTDISVQKRGVGSGIVGGLCAYLRAHGYRAVRLGWVKGNMQSESFWHKNHFVETGVIYETDGYTVIVAQRELGQEP